VDDVQGCVDLSFGEGFADEEQIRFAVFHNEDLVFLRRFRFSRGA
jgi:hypothetical protein